MLWYSLFKTQWGWFGLLGNDNGLVRAFLPLAGKEAVRACLLAGLEEQPKAVSTFGDCRERVTAYFEGRRVDFSEVPVDWSSLGGFTRVVLHTLSGVSYGRTLSYTELAALSGRPLAVRAAANAVAQNPLPLIIPCHRVVRKDGSLGGFSAAGGITTKRRLLNLESGAAHNRANHR